MLKKCTDAVFQNIHRYLPLLLFLCTPLHAAAETYFEAAQHFYESGQPTEARRALRKELQVRPGNLDARYDLAVLLQQAGHEEDAVKLYRENLEHGRHLPSTVNLSTIYLQHGQRNQAIRLLKAATKAFRHEAVPWYLLARIASQDGDLKLASSYYKRSLKADPLNGFAHIRYARFLASQGHIEAAIVHARRATKLLPECAECFKILGDIQTKKGAYRQALIAYQKSAALAPKRPLYERIAKTFESLGEHERADNIRRALQHATPHK